MGLYGEGINFRPSNEYRRHTCADKPHHLRIVARKGSEDFQGVVFRIFHNVTLLWECSRAIEIKRPRYILFENVKGLLSDKHRKHFIRWQLRLSRWGYSNFSKVLNTKEFGVPQNRERIFMISILKKDGEPEPVFNFPRPFPLEKRLKDVLEKNVDEKYYLSDKMLQYFMRVDADKSHGHNFTPKTGDDIAFTIRTAPGNRVDDNFVKEDG